jgi:hypothetical protein
VRRVDLRWGLYAYLLQDRTELVPELACGILRVPHIDNTEAALSLSGDVSHKSFVRGKTTTVPRREAIPPRSVPNVKPPSSAPRRRSGETGSREL